MPNTNTNILVGRNDTILGVCEAIGQDFGFHPNWLRVALAVMVYFAPVAVIGSYFALGAVVAASRWFAPDEVVAAPFGGTAGVERIGPRRLIVIPGHDPGSASTSSFSPFGHAPGMAEMRKCPVSSQKLISLTKR